MSKLLHLTNRLKAQAALDMLSPSQRTAYDALEKSWRFPERVNLCGAPGSGKTFLGWVAAHHLNAHFYASPNALAQERPPYSQQIIVDNVSSDERSIRLLLAELQLRQIHNLALITNRPNKLGFPVITLPPPTPGDIAFVYKNFSNLQFHPYSPIAQGNFWEVIHSVI